MFSPPNRVGLVAINSDDKNDPQGTQLEGYDDPL